MQTKGIRGAITVDDNTSDSIKDAVLELIKEMVKQNNIKEDKISHIIFTLTKDLNADFPAKFIRQDFGWNKVAMMCYHELDVPNSLKQCLRILLVLNCDDDFQPHFVYLKGAADLRK